LIRVLMKVFRKVITRGVTAPLKKNLIPRLK
jgi:hypothetical protein